MNSDSLEPAITELAVRSLHGAVRRVAGRLLEAPGSLDATQFRQVERLMRIAIALAGSREFFPFVQVHDIPPDHETSKLPGLFGVKVTNLLAARASDFLSDALQGSPEAVRACEDEAERILQTEDIQLV